MNLQEAFARRFPNMQPDGVAHCPYRVCPIGAHVDHQHGLVSGFALDRGVNLAYSKSDEPIIEMYSLNFDGQVRFTVKREPHRHNNWGDYARAAMKALFEHGYEPAHGFSGVVEGTLPVGGLSSSAAVVLTYLAVLCKVNGFSPRQGEMIDMALWAEQKFIGLNIGRLDQSCEVYCKKDHLLALDTLDGRFENIPQSAEMAPYQIGIFFSGVPKALVSSAYNARVDECRAAAYALKAYAGLPYEKVAEGYLRDVPEEVFLQYGARLPESFRKRAQHFYAEMARVRRGIEAWKRGDLGALGQLIFESGNSSIYNYESGSPELRALHEIMLDTPGIFGGRFSGAGFRGCCMAIVDPSRTAQIEERVTARYLDAFPAMRDKFSVHFCDTADGVTL